MIYLTISKALSEKMQTWNLPAFPHPPYHFPWALTKFAWAVLGLAASLSCLLVSLPSSTPEIKPCYWSLVISALNLEARLLCTSLLLWRESTVLYFAISQGLWPWSIHLSTQKCFLISKTVIIISIPEDCLWDLIEIFLGKTPNTVPKLSCSVVSGSLRPHGL